MRRGRLAGRARAHRLGPATKRALLSVRRRRRFVFDRREPGVGSASDGKFAAIMPSRIPTLWNGWVGAVDLRPRLFNADQPIRRSQSNDSRASTAPGIAAIIHSRRMRHCPTSTSSAQTNCYVYLASRNFRRVNRLRTYDRRTSISGERTSCACMIAPLDFQRANQFRMWISPPHFQQANRLPPYNVKLQLPTSKNDFLCIIANSTYNA